MHNALERMVQETIITWLHVLSTVSIRDEKPGTKPILTVLSVTLKLGTRKSQNHYSLILSSKLIVEFIMRM